jgi:hypothetical protein
MGRIGRRPALVALVASVTIAAGCSFIFTSAPSGPNDADCSTSDAPPVLDTIFGVLQLIRVVYAVAAPDSVYRDASISREADVSLGLGFVLLHGLSARYGYSAVSDCEKIRSSPPARFDRDRDDLDLATRRPRRVLPRGALGFTFGLTRKQARQECTSVGMSWSQTPSGYVCSGTVNDVGDRTASLQLGFCEDWLCRVELFVRPDSGNVRGFATLFAELRRELTRRYGDPHEYDVELPQECKPETEFLGCVSKGKAHGVFRWRWPSGHLIRVDLAPARDGQPMVHARFVHPSGRTYADDSKVTEADARASIPVSAADAGDPGDAGTNTAEAGVAEDAAGGGDS